MVVMRFRASVLFTGVRYLNGSQRNRGQVRYGRTPAAKRMDRGQGQVCQENEVGRASEPRACLDRQACESPVWLLDCGSSVRGAAS